MALYHFTARDSTGKRFDGEVDALDEKSVIITLQKQGYVPVKIHKKVTSNFIASIKVFLSKFGVGGVDIAPFTRQLHTMISSGLPLTECLVILEKQTKDSVFSQALSQIVADVEGGSSLSAALSKFPRFFDTIYIKLIEAGEAGGVLDKILEKLAESLEKDKEFKAKTKGALVYPVIVVVVMVVVMIFMMIFVIPKLTSIYEEIGVKLPLVTRAMIAASKFMAGFWWLILIFICGLVFGLRFISRIPKVARFMSILYLEIPIWGKIKRTLILAQFTRTFALLIGSGIPIIAALKIVSGLLASPIYKEAIDEAIMKVEHGSPIYQPLAASSVFPPILGQMLRVGEETGKMDDVLLRLSIYFENEAEHLINNLTTALEPIILLILGIGVGILVFSIIMPIYNLTSQF